jgi:hypothetical protein
MHPIRKLRESGHATPEQFAAFLAADVVMHSPVLTRAILGRDAVAKTMAASSRNRDNPGVYVLERKLDDATTFLRWQGTIDGHEFESFGAFNRWAGREAEGKDRRLQAVPGAQDISGKAARRHRRPAAARHVGLSARQPDVFRSS